MVGRHFLRRRCRGRDRSAALHRPRAVRGAGRSLRRRLLPPALPRQARLLLLLQRLLRGLLQRARRRGLRRVRGLRWARVRQHRQPQRAGRWLLHHELLAHLGMPEGLRVHRLRLRGHRGRGAAVLRAQGRAVLGLRRRALRLGAAGLLRLLLACAGVQTESTPATRRVPGTTATASTPRAPATRCSSASRSTASPTAGIRARATPAGSACRLPPTTSTRPGGPCRGSCRCR